MKRPLLKPWLNWRDERERLASVLNQQGGVVRVQASHSGPLLEFASVFRSHLEHGEWTRPWVTIQFDPDNSSTRYFGEMTRQMERSLSIPADLAPSFALGDGSKLGADLHAGSISINNSFNFEQSEYEQSLMQEKRADRIAEAVFQTSKERAVCLLFLHSEGFLRQDLEKFRSLLWTGRLERHATNGVLLVDLSRHSLASHGTWPPEVDVHLELSDHYDSESRQNAIQDLSKFLYEIGREASELEAHAYSRAMLDNNKGASTLYAQLAAVLAQRKINRD